MRLTQTEAAELNWYWSESEAELGIKSNFPALVARLEGLDIHEPHNRGVDWRAIKASSRMRRVERALKKLSAKDALILWVAYSGIRSRLSLAAFAPHEPLMLLTTAAKESHESGGGKRLALTDWAEAVSRRLVKDKGTEKDRFLRKKILLEIDGMLSRACQAYLSALSRKVAA